MNDLQKWIRIRKDLYRQMEAQVKNRLGGEDAELTLYRQQYEREFRKKWRASTKEDLFQRLQQSRLILMGDFHALQQSQKTHLRVLKNFETTAGIADESKPLVLCLECFSGEDQVHLDRFFAGKISEKDFLKVIDWEAKWGFPFDFVRPLIRWAQQKKIPVYGLNRILKKRTAATLKSRDRYAASRIHQVLKQHPDAVVFVIFGDLHLAKDHIPAEILKLAGPKLRGKMFRLFQNAEKIYFELLEKEIESTVDVVELTKDAFCLLNVPPWVKWQNYLMYLEQTYDLGLDDEDEDDALDYTDHVVAYVKIIAEELGLSISSDDLSVYTARDQNFWAQLPEHFSAKELAWIEAMIEEETSFYLPGLGFGYLARPTVNHAATLAAKYIHAKVASSSQSFLKPPDDFLRQIWEEGIAYFLSKIINHKRKTDTIADLRMALSTRGGPNATQLAKEPLMLALSQKMNELMTMSHRPVARPLLKPKKRVSYLIAARLLGGMMGERLYGGYSKRLLSDATLQQILRKKLGDPKFDAAYFEMMEIVESLPAPFRSKKERL